MEFAAVGFDVVQLPLHFVLPGAAFGYEFPIPHAYRTIAFMVAAEFTNWPIVRSFMRLIDCIPVRRGTRDPGATKTAIRHLRAGKAVGIFIESRKIVAWPLGQFFFGQFAITIGVIFHQAIDK